jgi:hypothetical protein
VTDQDKGAEEGTSDKKPAEKKANPPGEDKQTPENKDYDSGQIELEF